ncbi:MAG: hypothetical protein J6P47_00195 [Acetobacter sp.]|nr:hypothetical protein [Acetobacter sp.]
MEQTTSRTIPEDEVPPYIRWKIGKTSKKEIPQFCEEIYPFLEEIMNSEEELREILEELAIPQRIFMSCSLEMLKIVENTLSIIIVCAENCAEEDVEGLRKQFLEVRGARELIEDYLEG